MIQDKTTYIPRSYWQSTFITFRKALALCLKVFKIIDQTKVDTSKKDFHLVVNDDGKFKCTSCEQCMTVCPTDCLTVKGNKHLAKLDYLKINRDNCISCYLCVDICPEDAIYLSQKINERDAVINS